MGYYLEIKEMSYASIIYLYFKFKSISLLIFELENDKNKYLYFN